jgi:hypothetical protein
LTGGWHAAACDVRQGETVIEHEVFLVSFSLGCMDALAKSITYRDAGVIAIQPISSQ